MAGCACSTSPCRPAAVREHSVRHDRAYPYQGRRVCNRPIGCDRATSRLPLRGRRRRRHAARRRPDRVLGRAPGAQAGAARQHAPVRYLPAFQWTPVAGVDHYEFEIAADAGFNAPVTNDKDDHFDTWNTRATLKIAIPNGEYWWRVRGVRKNGAPSKWSAPRSFQMAWNDVAGPAEAGRRRHGQLPAARHARVVAGGGREEVQGAARLRPRARLAGLQAHRRLHAGHALHARGAARAGHVLLEHHAGRRARPRGRRLARLVVHLGLAVDDGRRAR